MPTTQDEPAKILQHILARALRLTFDEMSSPGGIGARTIKKEWSEAVRDNWIRGLRKAFQEIYPCTQDSTIVVFGGKPSKKPECISVRPCEAWNRWELLYDVAVVEMKNLCAPYGSGNVPLVHRAIWQVESEIARNGTKVAEDFSKLRMGKSENQLLVAAQTLQTNKGSWLDFLGRLSAGLEGNVFLALAPSYASGASDAHHWRDRTASLLLYRRGADGRSPQQVGSPITALPALPRVCDTPK